MNLTYYNDNEPFVIKWLDNLMKRDLISYGGIDERPTNRDTNLVAVSAQMLDHGGQRVSVKGAIVLDNNAQRRCMGKS